MNHKKRALRRQQAQQAETVSPSKAKEAKLENKVQQVLDRLVMSGNQVGKATLARQVNAGLTELDAVLSKKSEEP